MGSGDAATLVGTVLDARFRITGLIGVGSMGSVYRADDTEAGGEVAVKVLHAPFAVDERAVARFRREATAASQLRHEGCVRIVGYGVDGAQPYIAMELLEGETLHQLLSRRGKLSTLQTLRIGVQVCAALEVAHEQGVVHRDLKPENIMVLSGWRPGEMRVKILDFGIAKLVTPMTADSLSWETGSKLTQPGTALGTPAFMAPEQVRGDAIDDRTDIYVVGVLLYEMVTGCVPFGGDDPVQVLTAQLRESPTPPTALQPDLHPELERAILTCMEKSRAARWPTVRVLRQFLEQLLGQLERALDEDEVTREQEEDDDDDENDYGLTEPVDLRWARQRIAALRELGIGKKAEDTTAVTAQRETAETRVEGRGQVKRSPRSDQSRTTSETRVVSDGGPPRPAPSSRETSQTRIVTSSSPAPPTTRAERAQSSAHPPDDDGEDVPTIEVYDDDSIDLEMQIETLVKEREPIPGLEEAIARAKARTAERAVKRGGAAGGAVELSASELDSDEDSFDDAETIQQRKDTLPDKLVQLLARDPAGPRPSPGPGPGLTAEDLDSVTQPKDVANLPGKLAKLLEDSAMSVSSGDLEILSEESPAPNDVGPPRLTPLVEDDSLDRSSPYSPDRAASPTAQELFDGEATVARPPRRGPGSADQRSSSNPSLQDDDDDDAMATAIKPISEDDIDAAVRTAVRQTGDDEIDAALATAVTRQTDLPADAEILTSVTRRTEVPDDDEAATMVQSPEQAALEVERALEARARQQTPGRPDWEEDNKPTTMMARSQLADGLPEEMQKALQAELGSPLEATVDDLAPALPPIGLAGASSQPPAGGHHRTVPLTAPLPAVSPNQLAGPQVLDEASASPSLFPPPFDHGGSDDLDEMLRRMPRTRYPVFSTFMAIVVMVAAAAGLVWLML